jgi:hypothetical protein
VLALRSILTTTAKLCGLAACSIWFLVACTTESRPIFASNNDRYGLSVEFFGEWVGPDGDRMSQFTVDHVLLRDVRSKESVQYRAADPSGLRNSLAYFRNVWSPDQEYLVLPAGRFDGFDIFNAHGALAGLKSRLVADSISVRYRGQSSSLWHGFAGWSGDHILQFEVEFESSKIPFSYDLSRKELSSTSAQIPIFDASNFKGEVPIQWSR